MPRGRAPFGPGGSLNLPDPRNYKAPAEDLRLLVAEAKDLADTEDRYQKALQATIAGLEQRKRLEGDLVALGYRQAPQAAATAEEQYQKALQKTVDSLERRKRLEADLIAQGLKKGPAPEKTEEEKYQEKRQKRIESLRERKRLREEEQLGLLEGRTAADTLGERFGVIGRTVGRGADELGVGTQAATAFIKAGVAVGVFTAALKVADEGLKLYAASFEQGQFSSGKFEDKLNSYLMKIPLLGEIAKESSRKDLREGLMGAFLGPVTALKAGVRKAFGGQDESLEEVSYAERERRLQQAASLSVEASGRAALRAPFQDRERQLKLEGARTSAQLQAGVRGQAEQFAITGAYTAASEAAQGRAGKTLGYGREAEQEDIRRGYKLAQSVTEAQAAGQRQQDTLGAERGMAGRQRQELEQKRRGEQRQVAVTTHELSGAHSDEQRLEIRLRLEARLAELHQTDRQLQTAMDHERGLATQQLQAQAQTQQQILTLKLQERDVLTGIIQQEKSRLQTTKENFGLMKPLERRAAVHVARKLSAGQPLTGMELQFAKGHSDLFGESLKKIGARNAGPEFEEIKRLQGLDARQKQAEGQRIKLDQNIKVNIDIDSSGVVKQLGEQLMPQIAQAIAQLRMELKSAEDRMMNKLKTQRGGALGGT